MSDHLIPQDHPEAFLDRPQIGPLSSKGAVMHLAHPWKKVGIMRLKVRKQFTVLAQSQIRPYHFSCEHLAVCQLLRWTSLTQTLTFGNHSGLCTCAKTGTLQSFRASMSNHLAIAESEAGRWIDARMWDKAMEQVTRPMERDACSVSRAMGPVQTGHHT
jgi:hypothetical protein